MVTLVLVARRLNGGLPRSVYLLQSGLVLNALGNGAAAPFLVIYLHDVRGIPLARRRPCAKPVAALDSSDCPRLGSMYR